MIHLHLLSPTLQSQCALQLPRTCDYCSASVLQVAGLIEHVLAREQKMKYMKVGIIFL